MYGPPSTAKEVGIRQTCCQPIQDPVPAGTLDVRNALHRRLALRTGDGWLALFRRLLGRRFPTQPGGSYRVVAAAIVIQKTSSVSACARTSAMPRIGAQLPRYARLERLVLFHGWLQPDLQVAASAGSLARHSEEHLRRPVLFQDARIQRGTGAGRRLGRFPGLGGNLVVRELVQSPNGDLGLKFVPEMIPACGPPLSLRMAANKGDVSGDFAALRVCAGQTLSYMAVDDVPHESRIRLTVRPAQGVEVFGVCLCGEGDYRAGSELSFRPASNHVQFAHPCEGRPAKQEPVVTLMDGDTGALPPVEGLNESFTLDIITKDRILDVCLGNRRTFIARRADQGGNRLFFFRPRRRGAIRADRRSPTLEGVAGRRKTMAQLALREAGSSRMPRITNGRTIASVVSGGSKSVSVSSPGG